MLKFRTRRWGAAALCAALLGVFVVLLPARPVLAAPACRAGSVFVLFARGSQDHVEFNTVEARAFYRFVQAPINVASIPTYTAELGNLDGNFSVDLAAGQEYPAVGPMDWGILSAMDGYYASVNVGATELRNFLNNRYANGACARETLVLGGYSQGAEVVGYAISGLGDEAVRHIAYVALYGDPRNNSCPGGVQAQWYRGNAGCRTGVLLARNPYVPANLAGRIGSWCDTFDGVCTHDPANLPMVGYYSTHTGWANAYANENNDLQGWISRSSAEIGAAVSSKYNELNPPAQPPPPPAVTGPDLFFVKTRNTNPAHGRVEVHTALPGLGYGNGAHAVTRFGVGEQNSGWFQMVGNDLWYIKTKNTGSGRVELHSATHASGYQSGESHATRFGTGEQDNGWFQMVGTDLFFIKTKNVGVGKVEVHSATRGSGYQSGQSNATWMPASDHSNGWFQMLGADLFFVKTKNVGPSGRVELHVAWASSGYQAADHSLTRFGTGEQDNGWFQIIHRDLWFIKTRNTGGTVEIHSATEASGYNAGQSNATWMSPLDQSNGWFQVGVK